MDNTQKKVVENAKERADELFRRGAEAWKRGDRSTAMTLYAESAALNPDGPGKHALEMANDIMDFFDPNQLNP